MADTEFKKARQQAGLSVKEAARLLSIDPVSVRRFETDESKPTARKPPPLALKVLDWYSQGIPPGLENRDTGKNHHKTV